MRKIIVCALLALSAVCGVCAQVVPEDLLVIEALINRHKRSYDKMVERQDLAAANVGISYKVKDLAVEYEKLKKKVAGRLQVGYAALELAYEVSLVARNLLKVAPLVSEYVDFGVRNAAKNPLLGQYYMKSYKGVLAEVNKCKELILYGNLVNSNLKEKLHMLRELNSSLDTMIYHLDGALFMGRGLIALGMPHGEIFEEMMQSPEVKGRLKKVSDNIKSNMGKK